MSKINITADTESGQMEVTLNDKKMENFRSVGLFFYPMSDGTNMVGADIETYMEDENGVRHYGRICASQSPQGRAAFYAGGQPSKHDGFITDPTYKNEVDKYAEAAQVIAKLRDKK